MSIISSVSSCFGKKSVESQNQSIALSDREKQQIVEKVELRAQSVFLRISGLIYSVVGTGCMLFSLSNPPNLLGVGVGTGMLIVGIDCLRIGQAMSKHVKAVHDQPQSFQDTFQKMVYLYKEGMWELKRYSPYFLKDSWIIGPTAQFFKDLAYDLETQRSDEMQLRQST